MIGLAAAIVDPGFWLRCHRCVEAVDVVA